MLCQSGSYSLRIVSFSGMMDISCEGLISWERRHIIHSFSKFEPICNAYTERKHYFTKCHFWSVNHFPWFYCFPHFLNLYSLSDKLCAKYYWQFEESGNHFVSFFLLIKWIPVKESPFKDNKGTYLILALVQVILHGLYIFSLHNLYI